jgi:AAA+ ATPase superfamily predicted ATPase
MAKFLGRKEELKRLTELTQKKTASFVVIRGRRRIGKSRLVEEFSRNFEHFYSFIGLAPEKNVTKHEQLEIFSRQMAQELKSPYAKYDDWGDAFWAIGEKIKAGRTLVFFDEISWMGSEDITFLGQIKNFWDLRLKKNDKLIFIVCGSASSWIEKNILSNTGFVGRISYTLSLHELPLPDCSQFWPKNISAYEKLKLLAVTGGIPKYLEEVDPKISAEENIRKLCFSKGGFLVDEFQRIFSSLFLRKSQFYEKIIVSLASGSRERTELCEALEIDPGGRISEYLLELELAGFVVRDYAWNLSSGADSKLRKYRLADNYLRFYLKYIKKNLTKINRDSFQFKSLTSLPEWDALMGFQFENMVLNNRRLIHQALSLKPEEIVSENPYYQHKTKQIPGCQIDYMIQTKFGTLYLCEIKFSKHPIGAFVIEEVQKKLDSLVRPKGLSLRPVLIHVNGVSKEVSESDTFSAIIDFSSFLV